MCFPLTFFSSSVLAVSWLITHNCGLDWAAVILSSFILGLTSISLKHCVWAALRTLVWSVVFSKLTSPIDGSINCLPLLSGLTVTGFANPIRVGPSSCYVHVLGMSLHGLRIVSISSSCWLTLYTSFRVGGRFLYVGLPSTKWALQTLSLSLGCHIVRSFIETCRFISLVYFFLISLSSGNLWYV